MKRCPACQRRYDETMAFCLEDGSALVTAAPAADDQPATIIMPDPRVTAPAPARPETLPYTPPQPYTQPPPPAWAPLPGPQSYAPAAAPGQGRGLAVASLVLAISAFAVFGFCIVAGAAGVNSELLGGLFILSALFALAGAILGIVAASKSSRDPGPRNSRALSVAALVLNASYLVLAVIFLILGALST